MKLGIGEIFRKASEIDSERERGEFFRTNWSPALGKMIEYALEPEFVWDLPEGYPPYTENVHLDQESNLYSEIRRLYIFLKGSGDHVKPIKKEINYIQLLENVSKDDALVLILAKEKKLPYNFTADQIREYLPGLLSLEAGASDAVAANVEEKPKPTRQKAKVATKPAKKPAAKKKPAVKKKPAARKTA